MNAISGILTALFLLAGTGYAMDKAIRGGAPSRAYKSEPGITFAFGLH